MGQQILPFYLVCDESASMSGAPIEAMNLALPELHQEIGMNPLVSDKTQFGIIGFSTEAEVLLELADLSRLRVIPKLRAKGGTNYAAALKLLKVQIQNDLERLKSQGNTVYRPVVFFLTDGMPTVTWKEEWDDLVSPSFRYHPNIVAFGIGKADRVTIGNLATLHAFIQSEDNLSPALALREFAFALTRSIVKSGVSMAKKGGLKLEIPSTVPGFTSVPVDAL